MIATIVKHQWFSGSPLPLNEWFGRNHWYQWFFNGFWSINHWPRCFFSLATIGLDGFAMVFGLATIGLDGFSMVANHWSNDGMVTIHRYGLHSNIQSICRVRAVVLTNKKLPICWTFDASVCVFLPFIFLSVESWGKVKLNCCPSNTRQKTKLESKQGAGED